METEVQTSDFVLVVCTKEYRRGLLSQFRLRPMLPAKRLIKSRRFVCPCWKSMVGIFVAVWQVIIGGLRRSKSLTRKSVAA